MKPRRHCVQVEQGDSLRNLIDNHFTGHSSNSWYFIRGWPFLMTINGKAITSNRKVKIGEQFCKLGVAPVNQNKRTKRVQRKVVRMSSRLLSPGGYRAAQRINTSSLHNYSAGCSPRGRKSLQPFWLECFKQLYCGGKLIVEFRKSVELNTPLGTPNWCKYERGIRREQIRLNKYDINRYNKSPQQRRLVRQLKRCIKPNEKFFKSYKCPSK